MLTAVISDYNWLPPDEADWWFVPLCDQYLVFDKFHRFNSSPSVIRQKNVGQNIYDMLDFICTRYQNLNGDYFFARSCLLFPKGRKPPLSNGNCSLPVLQALISSHFSYTEVNDYYLDPYFQEYSSLARYSHSVDRVVPLTSSVSNVSRYLSFCLRNPSRYSFCSRSQGYIEVDNSWYLDIFPSIHFESFRAFMYNTFLNYKPKRYVRFSPGASYILSSKRILRYPLSFYLYLRSLVSHGVVVGDAHLLERALGIIFSNHTLELR